MERSTTARRAPLVRRWVHRSLVAESIVLVHLFAGLQRWVPVTRWSRVLGRPAGVPEQWRGEQVSGLPVGPATPAERSAAFAVAAALRRLPWSPSCLAQAATAQVLLRQQGESGVVVIGLQRTEAGATWSSHAWLLGRAGALTGGRAAAGFTPATVFEIPGRLRAGEVDLRRETDEASAADAVEGSLQPSPGQRSPD